MVDQQGSKRNGFSGAMLLLVASSSACAMAYAQTPPHGATATADAACPPDAGTTAHAATDAGSTTATPTPPPATPYTGPPPYFFVRPPRVSAGLTPDAVHRVFVRAANQTALTTCYTNELGANPHAHFTASFRLEIIAGGFGNIDSVHVTPSNDTLRDCLRNAATRFEWPNPSGAPSTQVDAQIDLAPTPPPAGAHPHH